MILVDRREKPGKREKQEMVDLIRRFGVKAELEELPYGDYCFEGFDTKGGITIGVERKRLHDMLTCIDDSRYAVHQRLGMKGLYHENWLLIEGTWRPHDPKGILMESRDGCSWWECRPGGRPVLYSKLRRYLFSISRSGIEVMYTRDMTHSAYDLCELYHYYQKKDHTSLVTKQQMNIPAFQGKPSLVRRWAEELEGIGPKKAADAAKLFHTPQALANSEVMEWLAIPGVGVKTAEDVVRQIEGRKR